MPKPPPSFTPFFAATDFGGPPLVSVLVVNYNSGEWLTRCAQAVLANTVSLELLVGDNASSDTSLARLSAFCGHDPRLRVMENGANLGFAKAVNRLLDTARGRYLLLLNPDCLLAPDTLARIVEIFSTALAHGHPHAGMAGALIRNPDGSEQRGCRRLLPTPRSAFFRSLPFGATLARWFGVSATAANFDLTGTPLPTAPAAVPAISGAFMLVPREAVKAVGGMDEGYFLHCEDLDWCARFIRAGYEILFVPEVEIIHRQGACSEGRRLRVEWHKHRGMTRYFRKFHNGETLLLRCCVHLGIWLRFCAVALSILLIQPFTRNS